MTAYIFIGPTLPVTQARQVLDAVYLPPVQQGDVFRLVTLRRPAIIGIIDGYFNQVPAVWHKEILWAMAQGVHVFGAASMGALRAAELAPFGMQGIGTVFEAYRDGVLWPEAGEPFEDDDEVAVLHAPAELGYQLLSDAMVNIRCALINAEKAGIIARSTRKALVQQAKALFYTERRYDRLLELATANGLPPDEINSLAHWLNQNKHDQKRNDAMALLHAIGDHLNSAKGEKSVDYSFQHSTQWELATNALLAVSPESSPVLEELRLEGSSYIALCQRIHHQLLANIDNEPSSHDAPGKDLETTAAHELDARLTGLHDKPEAIDALWRRELSDRELQAAIAELPLTLLERHLLVHLRENGDYQRLQTRAEHKRKTLAACRSQPSHIELSGLQALQLQDWYFEHCLEQSMPQDIEGYVSKLGFPDMDAFNQALVGEYIYRNQQRQTSKQDRS